MPRKAKELTDRQVKALKRPSHLSPSSNYRVTVGGVGNLKIQIAPSGARAWIYRASIGGKQRDVGLGAYPDVSLSQARDRARHVADLIFRGIDPVEARKADRASLAADAARGMTFAEATERFLEVKLAEFDNEKHRRQWRATLDKHAAPVLGRMAVADVEMRDVLRALSPIWETTPETASRLRGRIEMVLNWATAHGYRTGDNPARWKGNLDATLPKPSKVAKVRHHPALPLSEAADWFSDLRGREGTATRALEFSAMNASRSGEVRGMTWAEVDLDAALWIIPAGRMKASAEHRVPLTSEAVDLLKSLPKTDSPFVFPAVKGGRLSDAALSAAMRRRPERPLPTDGGDLPKRRGDQRVHGMASDKKSKTP